VHESDRITRFPPEETAVAIRSLRASYGSRVIVDHVSMSVPLNRVTAIIGPSGSGKSTLLRCLNRMHEMILGATVQGAVIIADQDIYAKGANPSLVRRHIGMIFQRPNPLPTRSIYENVALGARLVGKHGKELDQIVEQSLRKSALWDEVKDRLKTSAVQLSGGQQQRLCIARTLAIEPTVILMDEPASALDPLATYRIEELMMELKHDYTIIVVTHNMQQASRVSDYTAFLRSDEGSVGQLVEFSPTDLIFRQPRDQRTEEYITGRYG
jgi:phosphate transport system ATP-binding protein